MPAFIVRGDNTADVVFCKSLEAAKQQIEYGVWLDMEEVEPAPQYDQYESAGKVPLTLQLLDGWWFECPHCGCQIDEELAVPPVDEDGEPDEDAPDSEWRSLEPIQVGDWLYCSQSCLDEERAARSRAEANRQMVRVFLTAKFPGITVISCWGGTDGNPVHATFRVSDLRWPVDYSTSNPDRVRVAPEDADAWKRYRDATQLAEGVAP